MTRKINQRMLQFHHHSPEAWKELLHANGFRVDDMFGFLPHPLCTVWSILIGTWIRVLSLLKLLPFPRLQRAMAAITFRRIEPVYGRTPVRNPPEDCGYLMISAVADAASAP